GPFWAPDSHRLAFFADGKLKKTDVSTGGVQVLGDAPGITLPGTWNRDGVILLGGFPTGMPGIVRLPDSAGPVTPVTAMDAAQNPIQFLPYFLPDGRHFLFHTVGREGGSVYLGSLDSKSTTRVAGIPDFDVSGDDSAAVYAQGYLLFSRDQTLLAQP